MEDYERWSAAAARFESTVYQARRDLTAAQHAVPSGQPLRARRTTFRSRGDGPRGFPLTVQHRVRLAAYDQYRVRVVAAAERYLPVHQELVWQRKHCLSAHLEVDRIAAQCRAGQRRGRADIPGV